MSKREKKLNGFTREYLASLFDYNPDTGDLKWKVNRGARAKAGGLCGAFVNVDSKCLRSARVAYFLVTGDVPERIKFAEGGRLSFGNLIPCSLGELIAGARKRSDNTSTFRGVRFDGRRRRRQWEARLTVDGRQHHIGHFEGAEEAARAYNAAAREHFGEFAKLNILPEDRDD
jgi:hypothetical protein